MICDLDAGFWMLGLVLLLSQIQFMICFVLLKVCLRWCWHEACGSSILPLPHLHISNSSILSSLRCTPPSYLLITGSPSLSVHLRLPLPIATDCPCSLLMIHNVKFTKLTCGVCSSLGPVKEQSLTLSLQCIYSLQSKARAESVSSNWISWLIGYQCTSTILLLKLKHLNGSMKFRINPAQINDELRNLPINQNCLIGWKGEPPSKMCRSIYLCAAASTAPLHNIHFGTYFWLKRFLQKVTSFNIMLHISYKPVDHLCFPAASNTTLTSV